MDYGKSAYLKIYELESRINSLSKNTNGYSSYLELSKPNINQDFDGLSSVRIEFPEFDAQSESVCFQANIHLRVSSAGNVKSSLIVNGLIISEDTKAFENGEGDFMIIKTFSPLNANSLKVELLLTGTSPLSATVKSVDFVVLGAKGESANADIEFRAMKVDETSALISYIDDGKLYYLRTSLEKKTFSFEDFTFYGEARGHCFCKASFENSNINLYRIDENKNLYVSSFPSREERLVAKNVDSVFACTCPSQMNDTNLILLIKNGTCFYKTLRAEGEVVERPLTLPKGEYTDIYAVSHPESEIVYIIAANKNGSNYIARSLIEVSTGKISEYLKADYLVAVKKYIDMGAFKSKLVENLSLDLSLDLKSVFQYDEVFERVANEHLNLSANLGADKYKIVPPINYGVRIDLANFKKPLEWATYTDDAANFTPAVMDTTTGVLQDNGWLDRWPFDSLRPCIIKDGKVVGYLNKDNYAEFEDGTPSNITDKSVGDVMVEFPKIYYRIARDPETGDILLNIANREFPGFTKDAFVYKGKELDKVYIGVYLSTGDCKTEGFHSFSGAYISTGTTPATIANFYKYLRTMDPRENFEFMTYRLMYLIQIMYIIMFRTTKSANYYSSLYRSDSIKIYNGLCDDKGMYYGKIQSTTAQHANKLFGLENLFGARQQVMSGIRCDADRKVYVIDPYDPEGAYDPEGTSKFVPVLDEYTPSEIYFYVAKDINASNDLGFFHIGGDSSKYTSSSDQGFCDETRMQANGYVGISGYGSSATKSGLLTSYLIGGSSALKMTTAGRLVYFPVDIGE